jgi:hypothetical protein
VTFAGPSSNGISRNSILRFDPAATSTTLTATNEWNFTTRPVTGANLGIEAITWIPDTFRVSKGFFDESKGNTYSPAEYPNHGTGLFFVGLKRTQWYTRTRLTKGTAISLESQPSGRV